MHEVLWFLYYMLHVEFILRLISFNKFSNSLFEKGDELGTNPQPSDGMLCDYCQSSNEKNRFGQREDLLVCKDCSNKGEISSYG